MSKYSTSGRFYYLRNKKRLIPFYVENNRKRKKIIKELIEKAKDVPCMDCGERHPTYVMDFDHKPGSKKIFCLGAATSCGILSRKRVVDEIAKCEVVCANCHRKRTHKRKILSSQEGKSEYRNIPNKEKLLFD